MDENTETKEYHVAAWGFDIDIHGKQNKITNRQETRHAKFTDALDALAEIVKEHIRLNFQPLCGIVDNYKKQYNYLIAFEKEPYGIPIQKQLRYIGIWIPSREPDAWYGNERVFSKPIEKGA